MRTRTTRRVAWTAAAAAGIAFTAAPGAAAVTTVQSIADGATAAQLAAAIAGDGVTVSNVTFSGDGSAGGLFSETDPAVYGFTGGAVLSTGMVGDLPGPNSAGNTTTAFSTAGDSDLTTLAGFPTFDAATLSFDFVPNASSVFIRYVFGSEEYNEWVDTEYNDVFGFYVNGQNCAKTAGGDPVTINTINNNVNSGLYRDNEAGGTNTEMDGYTVPLVCTAAVTPNVTNTMKLVIADAGDEAYDSWVLLASGGVTTTPQEICDDGIDNDGDGLVDAADPDCEETPPPGPEICDDGIDNDGDGLVDAYDPDCETQYEPGTLTATKYYDANANGTRDNGEVGIAGWSITATGGGTTTDLTTGADGSASSEMAAGDYTVTEADVAGWKHVSPSSVDATVVDGADTAVSFGNLCLGSGGAHTKGFWQNKNGEALFKKTASALPTLQALHLEDAKGNTFDPTTYAQFRTWVRSASANPPAYMLSAQLATMALNVQSGITSGSDLVYAPEAPSANEYGYTTVSALMADADASLAAGTDKLSLSEALDKANNNTTFVQDGPQDCPSWSTT